MFFVFLSIMQYNGFYTIKHNTSCVNYIYIYIYMSVCVFFFFHSMSSIELVIFSGIYKHTKSLINNYLQNM